MGNCGSVAMFTSASAGVLAVAVLAVEVWHVTGKPDLVIKVPDPPKWTRRSEHEHPPDEVTMWGFGGWVSYPGSTRRGNPVATDPRPSNFQQEGSYSNMRIKVIYGGSDISDSATWSWVQSTLMPQAVSLLESMLKVVPVSGTLYVPRQCTSYFSSNGDCHTKKDDAEETCGTDYGTVAAEDLGEIYTYASAGGAETLTAAGSGGYTNKDYILYVTAKTGHCSGNALGYGGACRYDQYDRPVVGFANLCPSRASTSSEDWDQQYALAIHELLHALGFSSSRYSYFWDHTSGSPRTQRCAENDAVPAGYPCAGDTSDKDAASNTLSSFVGGSIRKPATTTLNSFTERGETVWKILTSEALSQARTHFSCNTLNGVELENGGGSGTAGSHWENRIYSHEIMTGVIGPGPVVTKVTLGFMHDTGWYRVDYTNAAVLLWGNAAGCDFATEKCLTPGATPSVVTNGGNFFCTESSTRGCNVPGLGYGICDVDTGRSGIPASMQYYTSDSTKGGGSETRDYCPYIQAYSNRDCRFSSNAPNPSVYGESFSTNARCFPSTLAATTYTNGNDAGCFTYQCDTSNSILKIWVACPSTLTSCTSQYVSCPNGGGAVSPPGSMGLSGSITCPSYTSFCDRGWTGLGVVGYSPPTPSPTAVQTSGSPSPPTTATVSNVCTFSSTLSASEMTSAKEVYSSELSSSFPEATWTVSMSQSRRSASYTLTGVGTGSVSSATLASSQSSFTSSLQTALTDAGLSVTSVSAYTYSVEVNEDSATELEWYYYVGGAFAFVLLVACLVCCICRCCSSCPWAKRVNREKMDQTTTALPLPNQAQEGTAAAPQSSEVSVDVALDDLESVEPSPVVDAYGDTAQSQGSQPPSYLEAQTQAMSRRTLGIGLDFGAALNASQPTVFLPAQAPVLSEGPARSSAGNRHPTTYLQAQSDAISRGATGQELSDEQLARALQDQEWAAVGRSMHRPPARDRRVRMVRRTRDI